MENREPETGNVKWVELTGFLFSVSGFRFSIAFPSGRSEKIDTLGKEGGPEGRITLIHWVELERPACSTQSSSR